MKLLHSSLSVLGLTLAVACWLPCADAVEKKNHVIIGDSLSQSYTAWFRFYYPLYPESWDTRSWPEILDDKRGEWFQFVSFDNNEAVPTAKAADWAGWLTDNGWEDWLFRNTYMNPALNDADRVVIFIGGNDIDNAYPGYTCRLMVTIVSTGDAPLMRAAPAISTVPAITVTPDDDTCGNLAPGAEWVTGYAIRINQVAEQEAIYGFTIDTRFAEAEPGTIGFWGNWDAHDTFVASDIEGWLAAIDASSDWLGPTTMSGTDELFDAARGRSTMEARFLAHYLATRLNDQAGLLCAAAGHNIRGVDPDNYLGLADPEDAGLADIITAIEAKAGTAPTRQQYEVLKSISDGLNNASF